MPNISLRLLRDPPVDGPTNMARDESLLIAIGERSSRATLRFYAWGPATISLGYFQSYAEFVAMPSPIRELPVVRRTTGGGAILHDLELTYSLVLPVDHAWLARGPVAIYERIHDAIVQAVGAGARRAGCERAAGGCGDGGAQRGPFFCFARRHALDVVVPDAAEPCGWSKLAGSAQRRTNAAVLQHGSVILDSRFPQQPCATWAALGGPREPADAAERILEALCAIAGCRCVASDWSDAERALWPQLCDKYAGREWTNR